MMKLAAALWFAGMVALAGGPLAAREVLPVFLADNHAGTFAWISRQIDPDVAHTLVLVDAHHDSSAAERSDEIREQLRRVRSHEERAARVDGWLSSGRIQAYNWIEPLMPRPLSRVLWYPGPVREMETPAALIEKARSAVDGRLEVEPRDAGTLGERWSAHPMAGLDLPADSPDPVLLALDLDAFSGLAPDAREQAISHLWDRAMRWPGLAGVAIAVSRPWLADDGEADDLVRLVLECAARTRGAVVEIDATPDRHPDHSARAAALAADGRPVPRWDFAASSDALQRLVSRMPDWRVIRRDGRAPPAFLPSPQVVPDDGFQSLDGVWRFPAGSVPVLRAVSPYGMETTGRTRWWRLRPAAMAVDLIPHTGLGKSFAESAARYVFESRELVAETSDPALAGAGWSDGAPGRSRIAAEIETRCGQWIGTSPVDVRFRKGKGFRAALSECFGMPYVFGISGARERGFTGVDTGWGADCANLLAHAWRRNGIPVAWGDPASLRDHLVTLAEDLSIDDHPPITAADIHRGLAVSFGNHVAAVWEDREPLGVLDAGDLVVHQLGGAPEVVPLGRLAADRPVFSLHAPPVPTAQCRVRLAGDVVLAGDDLVKIDGFGRGDACLFLVNLEGVPSMREPDAPPLHDFRFPPERLAMLRASGVDCVSLANNHAGDAGRVGLAEALATLAAEGIPVVGAGLDEAAACAPWSTVINGVRIAVFGVCLVDAPAAGPGKPGVARLPAHASPLAAAMADARASHDHLIVLCHGGLEYSLRVDDDQRRWARWLIDHGATVISGSHPHVVQPAETHAGARVSGAGAWI
jgi:hypothetical protein